MKQHRFGEFTRRRSGVGDQRHTLVTMTTVRTMTSWWRWRCTLDAQVPL